MSVIVRVQCCELLKLTLFYTASSHKLLVFNIICHIIICLCIVKTPVTVVDLIGWRNVSL